MKRGFTLIELLAVLIILSIIALITTPIVLNIINNAKKNSTIQSLNQLVNSKVLDNISMQLNDPSIENTDIMYVIEDGNFLLESKIEITGKLPETAIITVSKNGKTQIKAIDNGKIYVKEEDDATVREIISKDWTKESCFIFDKATGTVSGYKYQEGSCPEEVVFPYSIDGVVIKHISSGDYSLDKITGLDFKYLLGLNTLTSAFEFSNIEGEIKIDALPNLTSISSYAFGNSTFSALKLTNLAKLVDLSSAFNNSTFSTLRLENLPSLKTIGDSAIGGNTNLLILDLSKLGSLENIEELAFIMTDFNRLILPNSLKIIGNYAFGGSDNYAPIDEIIIPASVESIGDGAFCDLAIKKVIIKGKSSLNDFKSYGTDVFTNNKINGVIQQPEIVFEP